ncbi:MAG: hypothetical protein JF590_02660 [Gemmatimonadetes bacterium]|nr:hypothetical protein [Gemmatimonadota bacterium]
MTAPEGSEAAPRTGWRKWLPSYIQFRLTLLMLAIVLGLTGMTRNDQRLIKAAMVAGGIGIVMRFLKPRNAEGA